MGGPSWQGIRLERNITVTYTIACSRLQFFSKKDQEKYHQKGTFKQRFEGGKGVGRVHIGATVFQALR